jgi:hypothetical protein
MQAPLSATPVELLNSQFHPARLNQNWFALGRHRPNPSARRKDHRKPFRQFPPDPLCGILLVKVVRKGRTAQAAKELRNGRTESLKTMKQGVLLTRLALILVVVVVLFASPLPAMAQSCALCYTQAASAGRRMIEALKSGILILIVPPTLMSIGMVFIMYRKNQGRDASSTADSDAISNRTDPSIAATTPWHPPTQ